MVDAESNDTEAPDEIREVIAERYLILEEPGAPARQVRIMIGKPEPWGESFRCFYKIDGLGDGRPFYAAGADSLQALHLAFVALRAVIWGVNGYGDKARFLKWFDQPDIGIPKLNEGHSGR